jgi:serine/threonine-protein kinase
MANDDTSPAPLPATTLGAPSQPHPQPDAAQHTPGSPCAVAGAALTFELGGTPAAAPVSALPAALADRYLLQDTLGSGGHGMVLRAWDRVLDRPVAIKLLRPDLGAHEGIRRRFQAEARIIARLSHPGVVAIHDRGELDDGRLWFAMKLVRGRTLEDVIGALHTATGREGWRGTADGWTLRRCVEAVARCADAVAYAHSQGVVHRDLKPSNLMVGEFGEVLVMDWGLARAADMTGPDDPSGPVAVDAAPRTTRFGRALGTPAFMAPEQARGAHHLVGPHSDVYSLGCVLFMLLAGVPPFTGAPMSILRQVLSGPPPPLAAVVSRDHPLVPPALAELVEAATAPEPSQRPADAGSFARRLRAWLDGSERRSRARALVRQARMQWPAVAHRRSQAAELRQTARQLLDGVQSYDPVSRKAPAWSLEERAEELELEAAREEAEFLHTARSALQLAADLPEARELLADHARDRLVAAEARGDHLAAALHATDLQTYDNGRYGAFLRGDGVLSLSTTPPGATVEAFRCVRRQRRLVEEPIGILGRTPLREVALPRGSYVLVIRAQGQDAVRYPVLIERMGHWAGRPPGATASQPIVLPPASKEPSVLVPAGWFRAGGDPLAVDSLSARRVWVDGFVMARDPVTNAEWLRFVNDLLARGEEVADLVPRVVGAGHEGPAWDLDGRGLYRLPQVVVEPQVPWEPDAPVVRVSQLAARRYAAWLAARTGLPWRLPDELEWEKAARGVDGRRFPWGDHTDGTWACTADSHGSHARIAPVHAFPEDLSPYGIRGLGGNCQAWTRSPWSPHRPDAPDGGRLVVAPDEGGDLRVVRGGSWAAVADRSRSAGRLVGRPDHTYMRVGVRVVRDAEPTVTPP